MKKLFFILIVALFIVGTTKTFSAVGVKLSGQGNISQSHATYGKWAGANQVVVKIGSNWYRMTNAQISYDSSSMARITASKGGNTITLYYPSNIKTSAHSKAISHNARLKVKTSSGLYWAKQSRSGTSGTVRVNYIGDGNDKYVYGVFTGLLKKGSSTLSIKGNFKIAKP
jgi:hypothetical protein